MFLTPAGLHVRRHGSVRARASAGMALADGKVVDFYELLNVSGPVVNASGSQQLLTHHSAWKAYCLAPQRLDHAPHPSCNAMQ